MTCRATFADIAGKQCWKLSLSTIWEIKSVLPNQIPLCLYYISQRRTLCHLSFSKRENFHYSNSQPLCAKHFIGKGKVTTITACGLINQGQSVHEKYNYTKTCNIVAVGLPILKSICIAKRQAKEKTF